MVNDAKFKGALRGKGRVAARAVLCALLTLYLYNKSSLADGWDDFQLVPIGQNPDEWNGWPTNDSPASTTQTNSTSDGTGIYVESVFDFSVPVSVISNGVRTGIAGGLQESNIEDIVHYGREYINDYVNDALQDDDDFRQLDPDFMNFNTNRVRRFVSGESDSGDSFMFQSFGSQYSESIIDAAMLPDTNLLGGGPVNVWISAPSLSALQSFASTLGSGMDSIPDIQILEGGDTFLSGLRPESSFFPTECSADMILQADGGAFNSYISSIADGSPWVFLRDGWRRFADVFSVWLNQNKDVFRRLIGIACCIGYVILCIRWWLRRIFWLFEVFTGVSTGGDPFGSRNSPDMKLDD